MHLAQFKISVGKFLFREKEFTSLSGEQGLFANMKDRHNENTQGKSEIYRKSEDARSSAKRSLLN